MVIHNDPYTGGTHQADVVICRPMFYGETLIGFAINRGHWTDVGGMAPGGWSGTARHVVQEAFRMPATKLYEGGKIKTEIRRIIEHNVRFARQMWGDVQAQIASMSAGILADLDPRVREDILAVLGHVWYSTLVDWSSGRIDFDQVTSELDRAVRVLVEPYDRGQG